MDVRTNTTARRPEDGFTLIELSVAMLIGAFALVALAGAFAGGLRNVAVQKARTQGNELATQGIEDLQRYSYDHLGVCDWPANPPAGFETKVELANCTSPTFVHPCSSATGANAVPATSYQCTRRNLTYQVRRFVAYGDAARTTKRLAVVVTWTDTGGRHEVAQQSSLRSPTEASIIGLSPPAVTTATVQPGTVHINSTGRPSTAILLTTTAQGLGPTDTMRAHFKTLVGSEIRDQILDMTSLDGITWNATIPTDRYTFAKGSQFFYFNAVRESDGKANSRVATPANKFCDTTADATCSSNALGLPQFPTLTVPPTADIDPGGILQADVDVVAITKNVLEHHQVTMVFQTQSGAHSIVLRRDPAATCDASTCRWTGKVAKSAGYRFAAGGQKFYFTAAQALGPTPPDNGSTGARASDSDVVFG